MTLIVAVPAEDGLVFGSDQQVTIGPVRDTAQKIFQLNDHVLWGGSGELAVIQRVSERLETLSGKDQPLDAIRDTLAGIVRDVVIALIQADFRMQFFAHDPDALLQLHPADFLFAEYRDEKPRVLRVFTNGTSEWIDVRFAATGNGDLFAHALLKKYAGSTLKCERAKLLAYKVIEEAIEVGSYGLGPPVDVWEVGADGARQADEAEIAALSDAARLLREREIAMLTGDGEEDTHEGGGEPRSGGGSPR